MNRRELLSSVLGAVACLLPGFVPRMAKASPEAMRLAKNGIISPTATPHLVGGHTKVYVDGVLLSGVREVDVRTGEVTCFVKDGNSWKTRPVGPWRNGFQGYELVLVVHRGYVHVETKPNA